MPNEAEFDASAVARAVASACTLGLPARMSVLDALTRLELSSAAWLAAEAFTTRLADEFVAAASASVAWAQVLSRVPLPAVRSTLAAFAMQSVRTHALAMRAALTTGREFGPAASSPVRGASSLDVPGDWRDWPTPLRGELAARASNRSENLADEAALFEDAVIELATVARDDALSCEVLWRALLLLGVTSPAPLPIAVAHIVRQPLVATLLPRVPLAWAIGQSGRTGALQTLLSALADESVARRALFVPWIEEVCRQLNAERPREATRASTRGPAVITRAPTVTPRGPVPTATPMRAEAASLAFSLKGDRVAGNVIESGAEAVLYLAEGVAPEDAIHQVPTDAVAGARHADLDLLLLATARGAVSLKGSQFAKASFRGGRLTQPVTFTVAAHAGGDALASLHVEFLVNGQRVHEADLALVVSQSLPSESDAEPDRTAVDPAHLFATAAQLPAPFERQILLMLSLSAGRLRMTLVHLRRGVALDSGEYESADLDRGLLESLRKRLDAQLQPCYANEDVWSSFDGDRSTEFPETTRAALSSATEAIAAAGSLLYEALQSNGQIGAALARIEEAAQDTVLSITTDSVFLPWEILYPHPWPSHPTAAFRASNPLRPERFWGARFAIETDRRGTGDGVQTRLRHLAAKPSVALILNPDISMRGLPEDSQPAAVHGAWANRLRSAGVLDSLRDTCDDMRALLQDGEGSATVIYVYCHGASAHPELGTGEELLLDAQCRVEPRDLRTRAPFDGAPIVFINSCRSGTPSTLSFGSFLSEFRQRGALGMIGTSYAIPVVFGAHFAREVVDCCLSRQTGLAASMLALRRTHLHARGNPLPLLYTVQCHLH